MRNPSPAPRKNLPLPKVAVVGLCRDSESVVGGEIIRFEKAIRRIGFEPVFFLVESDSKDATCSILSQLQIYKENLHFVSLGRLETSIPNRIERLRYCRNLYVRALRADPVFVDSLYVFVVDFDIKNSALDLRAFSEFLMLEEEWSAVFCNQRGRYYDIYALREPNWSPDDCFKSAREKAPILGWEEANQISIWSRMRNISLTENIIPVDSAFGGLGIYKYCVFERFDYSIVPQVAVDESEHVSLHFKLKEAGETLFILPRLLNFSWNAHNLSSFKVFRTLDVLTRSRKFRRVRQILRKSIG